MSMQNPAYTTPADRPEGKLPSEGGRPRGPIAHPPSASPEELARLQEVRAVTPNPVAAGSDLWSEEVRAYLQGKGWEMVGENENGIGLWRDPGTSSLATHREVILPNRDGTTTTYRQHVAHPRTFLYPTDQAIMLQRTRDMQKGDVAPSPSEKLDELRGRHERLENAVLSAINDLKHLCQHAKPEKLDTFIRGWDKLQSEAGAVLTSLSSTLNKNKAETTDKVVPPGQVR